VEVLGSKNELIVFELITEDLIINNIYNSGVSIFNKFGAKRKRFFTKPATIEDSDGYTNVRSGKGTEFDVIVKINQDDLIFVAPSITSNWWKVFYGNDCSSGYIHKSRIRTYEQLDENRQNVLRKKIESLDRIAFRCAKKFGQEMED